MATKSALGRVHIPQQLSAGQDGAFESFGPSLSTSSDSSTRTSSHAASPSMSTFDADHDMTTGAHATPDARSQQGQSEREYIEVAPLPPRPGRIQTSRRTLSVPTPLPQIPVKPTSAAQTAAENRRQNVDPPSSARVYPNGNIADFSPWRGKHLEDNMSEQTIKSGFQNKPLITNESNTARPTLWSHLKNKGGPQTLSSLFVNIIDKRQISGRITGPSTFKPPPRVTMSNSRREAFLQELSNPSWPMRKLNRSVPHTISGRVLLDQCLNKNIPIPRAIWLSKCIGANDFRAFKRKVGSGSTSMSSEAKWIKDWTIHVEQFLQGIMTSVGEPDFKHRVDYGVRLSCHLYAENLLDHEHYIDWILTSLESTSAQHLPMWLLLVQIHWNSLTQHRKRGARLARSLLTNHIRIAAEDTDSLTTIMVQRLEEFIVRLACTNHACLILPRDWGRIRGALLALADKYSDEEVRCILKNVIERNDRLALIKATSTTLSARKARLIQILDDSALRLTRNQLAEQCKQTCLPLQDLIHTLLRWASTKFRDGRYRIYIISRLLQKLQQSLLDPEITYCNLIQVLMADKMVNHLDLFQVIVELVRGEHFSIGLFVQHLVAIGANGGPEDSDLLILLRHLPPVRLSDSSMNMRNDLLDTSTNDEAQSQNHLRRLSSCFQLLMSHTSSGMVESEINYEQLTLAQKFEIGRSVRQHVFAIQASNETRGKVDEKNRLEKVFLFSRGLLEHILELPCLADVLGLYLDSNDQAILTHVVHTLHYNYRCLISMGAMKSLFDKLINTYESVRHQQQLSRAFCTALLSLSTSLEAIPSLISQLTQDIFRCEQLNSMTMCSPVSDNAGEISQLTGDADDDIERILSSGTTMDNLLVHRVFDRITTRIEQEIVSTNLKSLQFGSWMSRLRDFDRVTFDGLLRSYITTQLATSDGSSALFDAILPVLVSNSCINLAEFVTFVHSWDKGDVKMNLDHQAMLIVDILQVVLPDRTLRISCQITDAYKFRLDQMVYAATYPDAIFAMLRALLAQDTSGLSNDMLLKVRSILESSQLSDFLRMDLSTLCSHKDTMMDMIAQANTTQLANLHRVVDNLMLTPMSDDRKQFTADQKISGLLAHLDELSLVVESLAFAVIQQEVSLHTSTAMEGSTDDSGLPFAVLGAVLELGSMDDNVCLQLLANMRNDFRQQIAKQAEQQFLSISLNAEALDMSVTKLDQANHLLQIFECTLATALIASEPSTNTAIIEKLRQSIAVFSLETPEMQTVQASDALNTSVMQHLELLLRLIIIRKQKSDDTKSSLDDFTLCSYLFILLQIPQLQLSKGFMDTVFDTATMLVDDLTDEQRSLLGRSDNLRASDPRINFLLDPQSFSSVNSWLGLILSQTANNSSATTSTNPSNTISRTPLSQPSSSQPSPRAQQFGQGTRAPASQQAPANTGRPVPATPGSYSTQKSFLPPTNFPLKPWELLPDQGNTNVVNDTAISLAMFGTKKV